MLIGFDRAWRHLVSVMHGRAHEMIQRPVIIVPELFNSEKEVMIRGYLLAKRSILGPCSNVILDFICLDVARSMLIIMNIPCIDKMCT